MFIQDKDSQFKEQQKTKPKIEAILADYKLTHPSIKETVMEFVSWLKANKFTLAWASSNCWQVSYSGRRVGSIRFYEGSFYIDCWSNYADTNLVKHVTENNLIPTIWGSIDYCCYCRPNCEGFNANILGKDFENICRLYRSKDPGLADIECAKKLLEYEKSIPHGTAARPVYDSRTNGLKRIGIDCIKNVSGPKGAACEKLFGGKPTLFCAQDRCDITFEMCDNTKLLMYSIITYKEDSIPESWELYGAYSYDGPWVSIDKRTKSDVFSGITMYFNEVAFNIEAHSDYHYYKLTFNGKARYFLSQVHFYTAS